MKPFNLEDAKAGKAVQTRNGQKITILDFNVKRSHYPLCTKITYGDGAEEILSHTEDGRFDLNKEEPTDTDLVMAPVTKTGFINIYENTEGKYAGENIFTDKAQASLVGLDSPSYVTTATVTWEE